MSNFQHWLKYSFTLMVVAVATLARLQLHPVIQDRMPFVTFTLAVMLIASVCGAYPAIMALGLSTLAAAHFIIPPEGSWSIAAPSDQLALATFFIIGIFSVSLLRRLESQREKAQAQAAENERLNAQLRELDHRKDEFISLLAHELRSPMAPIRNAIGLASRYPEMQPELQTTLGVISRNFQHLVRLVDDLLDVSRYLRGSIALRPEILNLGDCVREAIDMSSGEIVERKHELIVDLPSRPIFVEADPVRLCQMVANLLTNAAKYTPHGGRIHLELCVGESGIEIAVQDNGLGISEETQQRIFTPFYQANPKQTRYASGLGLGLNIVKKLVELHGGHVQVFSRGVNTGSRFTSSFPHPCCEVLRTSHAHQSTMPLPANPKSRATTIWRRAKTHAVGHLRLAARAF
jgi:signal transduction histidine kinase